MPKGVARWIVLGSAVVSLAACAGSPIGGKYGLGANEEGYAREARIRRERRAKIERQWGEFDYYCSAPTERSPSMMQWCSMRQRQIEREEDRLERIEAQEAHDEREFQAWRRRRLDEIGKPKPRFTCTSRNTGFGNTTTDCEETLAASALLHHSPKIFLTPWGLFINGGSAA